MLTVVPPNQKGELMKITVTLLALGILVTGVAWADPPRTLHVTETVQIKAPPDKVWSTIKDFDALAKWHPALASSDLVTGSNGTVGASRKLTLKGGGVIMEKLTGYDDAGRSYRYIITDSPLPVAHYSSTLTVRAGKNGMSEVVWSGTFKRKNASDNPPAAENDEAAIKVVKGVYRDGLDNLKRMLEG
jgi:Polyketide cyclase / dehydrase and lipid transport